ncbi:MAG TPA: hypothetical protein VIE67_03515 [Rudaea sp.]|jgi:two-component system OmpR family response regulator|uniref:hypothetical protein n=1 Tax=Rudaea sp. TaxID=2136325 RepID=UPI002F939CA1
MAKILTIEDDALTAREIVIELQNHGNEVDCVADGREGLNKALHGDYDGWSADTQPVQTPVAANR